MNQMQRNRIGTTLFVSRVQLAKLLWPGFGREVISSDRLTGERILEILREVKLPSLNVFGKEFPCAMAEQLMERDDQS